MKPGKTFIACIDGKNEKAELLDILEYKNERYAVYAVTKGDVAELYTSKVIIHNGEDELVPIDDEEVKQYLLHIIHETTNR